MAREVRCLGWGKSNGPFFPLMRQVPDAYVLSVSWFPEVDTEIVTVATLDEKAHLNALVLWSRC